MKIKKYFTYLGLATAIALSTVSCEKEIDNIGVDLIDNDMFDSKSKSYSIESENTNKESVKAIGLGQYLLGIYKDTEFGTLKGSIISQLSIPKIGDKYTYGKNMTIDEVILDLPYQSTRNKKNHSDGRPQFSIDSVFGVRSQEFKINVYELGTYLNTLDPNDPSKNATYLSNKEYLKGPSLYRENFKVSHNDTVVYVERYMLDGTIYDTDTIKSSKVTPSIKLKLNKTLIKNIFVDNNNGIDFSSLETFKRGFRGLYIEPEAISENPTHLVSLLMKSASMKIYFSNDVVKNEGKNEDLNGNGIKGEKDVTVRTKNVFNFSLSGIKTNKLERDYTQSKASGTDRLYIQGAAGSEAVIELFIEEDIAAIRAQNLLITEANLVLYIDQNADTKLIPSQLYIYDYTKNEHIRDIFTEGISVVGGKLLKDSKGKSLHKYKFRITDYISDILTTNKTIKSLKLGIKVYNGPSEMPANNTDITIKNLSWTPKGVVIFNESDVHGDKKLKLDISYSKLNE
ncbi:MAG: hypothetical protein COB60_01765 [Flavobacteriaceae bacterium]|nr:MAG: hypothetical protein COB60_01765 [Flavobacteriaceae bacterium]